MPHQLLIAVINIFLFVSIGGAQATELIDETKQHIKSGALLGKNMSLSKDDLVLEVLSKHLTDQATYCLEVSGQNASDELLHSLGELGQQADSCSGETIVSVSFGGFAEPSPGQFSLAYSYQCGPRCGGGYDCYLRVNSQNILELLSCKQKWLL